MADHVTDQDFDEKVLKSDKPVMVDFYAEWCGPCKMLAPIVDELAKEEGDVKVVKLDVDSNQATAQKYGVMSIPQMLFFKGGEEVNRLTGAVPKDTILEALESVKA